MQMKRVFVALALAGVGISSMAGTNVGVSVSVNQPGVYGRIDIGNVPTPPVFINQQPVIIAPPAVVVEQQPIYLHVPPGHAKNWRKYCGRYNACGQPVYFVHEDWYQQHYVPERERQREHEREHGHDKDRGHGKGHDKHDKHDD
jgi:hypothetical protein